MDYQLAVLKESMLPELLLMEQQCFKVPWTEKMFAEELKNPIAVYRVILFEEKPVAYMGMWLVADEGQITNVAVSPQHRGQGLAKTLIRQFVDIARREQINSLTLEVRVGNAPAIGLYQSLGFRQVGLRRNYYEGKEDALLMNLDVWQNPQEKGEN